MSAHASLVHFENFARLHRATLNDLDALEKFSGAGANGSVDVAPHWSQWIATPESVVMIATECSLIVGVSVIRHRPGAAIVELDWLAVATTARRRGVGGLLLETVIDRAQSEGAAVIVATLPGNDAGMPVLLENSGFMRQASRGRSYVLNLWNELHAVAYGDIPVPVHAPVTGTDGAAAGLLMAMAALDDAMLLTDQVERTLHHEITHDRRAPDTAMALARAAARRRFWVTVHGERAKVQPVAPNEFDIASRISVEMAPLTPEKLIGCLSRRQVPLLYTRFARLAQGEALNWYLVTGFDGFLFQVIDVARQRNDRIEPKTVTATELRDALRQSQAETDLIVSRVL